MPFTLIALIGGLILALGLAAVVAATRRVDDDIVSVGGPRSGAAVALLLGLTLAGGLAFLAYRQATTGRPGGVSASTPVAATPRLRLSDALDGIRASGLHVGDEAPNRYAELRAVNGLTVEIEGAAVDLYEFDVSVTSGRDALAALRREGDLGRAAVFRENLALVIDARHPARDRVVRAFE